MDIDLEAMIAQVTGKRPRAVLDHIRKHGFVTTQELKDLYGYNHPPRAARDVRELGIPLDTFRVSGNDGRKIAAYRLGDPESARSGRMGGRRAFSKVFKTKLVGFCVSYAMVPCTKLRPYAMLLHGNWS